MPVAAVGETVAVSVTLSPTVGEVFDELSVVVVDVVDELTVMETALDVLVAYALEPV